MTKLTIVTCTANIRPEFRKKCIDSVAAALRPGDEHVIINTLDYRSAKVDALRHHEFVAFVDDDDFIEPDSITNCMTAISESGVAVAFTNEVIEDVNGKFISSNTSRRRWMDITISPIGMHHLCVFNTSHVSPDVQELDRKFGIGIDWFMKTSAALSGGAIHVPKVGYHWVKHLSQDSQNPAYQKLHAIHQAEMSAIIQSWAKVPLFDFIPVYQIPLVKAG